MSRLKVVVVVAVALALLAPAAHAQSSVRAVVKFSSSVSQTQRVSTVRSAGGRVVKVRRQAVVARMTSSAADSLRMAMGVVAVKVRS